MTQTELEQSWSDFVLSFWWLDEGRRGVRFPSSIRLLPVHANTILSDSSLLVFCPQVTVKACGFLDIFKIMFICNFRNSRSYSQYLVQLYMRVNTGNLNFPQNKWHFGLLRLIWPSYFFKLWPSTHTGSIEDWYIHTYWYTSVRRYKIHCFDDMTIKRWFWK